MLFIPAAAERLRREGNQRKPRSFSEIVVKYAIASNAPGWQNLGKPEAYRRYLWFVVLCGVTLGFCIHLFFLVAKYQKDETMSQYYSEPSTNGFPDVTVCLSGMLQILTNTTNYTVNGYGRAYESLVKSGIQNFWRLAVDNLAIKPGVNEYDRSLNPISRKTLMPYAYSLNLSHNMYDMLMVCFYGDKPCTFSNWKRFWHADLYNCYTFKPEVGRQSKTLTAVFYTNNKFTFSSDLEFLNYFSGMYITINSPNTYPSFSKRKWVSTVSFKTKLQYTEQRKINLNKPDSPCATYNGNKTAYYRIDAEKRFVEKVVYPYNQETCNVDNMQRRMLFECGCYAEDHPIVETLLMKDVPLCHSIAPYYLFNEGYRSIKSGNDTIAVIRYNNTDTPFNKSVPDVQSARSRKLCYDTVKADMAEKGDDFYCPIACNTSEYVIDIDRSQLGDDNVVIALQTAAKNSISLAKAQQINTTQLEYILKYRAGTDSDYSTYYTTVEIVPATQKVQVIEEAFAYPAWNFWSDFGGILGLWMGCSALTLIEASNIILELAKHCCSKRPNDEGQRTMETKVAPDN